MGLTLALALAAPAGAVIVIDFETEDDFSTALVNGQIVDPAFDGADPEFGNLFNLTTSQLGAGTGHLGATIFDSDPAGPNSAGADPDLLVDTGNVLMLQNASFPATTLDGTYGLLYDTPNDNSNVNDNGSLIFDFTASPWGSVHLLSLDLIDANGGFLGAVILTDTSNNTRTYTIPTMWTGDIDVCIGCDGYDTLDLTSLIAQLGEGGSSTSVIEDLGFDDFHVKTLEVQFIGNPSSGALDNITFIPEPSTGLLLLSGLAALAHGRRRRLGRS